VFAVAHRHMLGEFFRAHSVGSSATASRIAFNSPPAPRTPGVDLQHRAVHINRFGVLGESDISNGVLVETAQRLPDLGRLKSGIDSIQHGKDRPFQDRC
jgi:hypothetical protein